MEQTGFLDLVAQTLVDGVAVWDVHGRLAYANSALERLLGYEPGELAGLHWTRLFPVELPTWAQAWQMPRVAESTSRHESNLLRQDGTTVPVLVSSRRITGELQDGQVLSTFTDLSERHDLEARVQDLEKLAASGLNLSSMVHELNNALTILSLQSRLLSLHRHQNPEVGENVAIIQDQTRRMVDMIDSLRSSDDAQELSLAPTDINALVSHTCDLQLGQFRADGIALTLDLAPDLPDVLADSDKLEQVFVNIANNARQAVGGVAGSGALRISTGLAQPVTCQPPRLHIQFADNGPGIPANVLPCVFEPFFTTKDANKGMGLGLSICEQIMTSHGGCIRAENNAWGGATLTLELPVNHLGAQPGSCATEHAQPALHPSGDRAHLLIVDDEEDVTRAVKQALEMAGYHVMSATGAQQALGVLERNHIDLVITDVVMSPMGGQQFWLALKQAYPHLSKRVIFATGDSSGWQWRDFLRERDCAYISKPFHVNELVDLVHDTLSRECNKIESQG